MQILIIGEHPLIRDALIDIYQQQDHSVWIFTQDKQSQNNKQSNIFWLQAQRDNREELKKIAHEKQWDVVYDLNCDNADEAKLCCDVFSGKVNKYILLSSGLVYGHGKRKKENDVDLNNYHFLQPLSTLSSSLAYKQIEATYMRYACFPLVIARLPIILDANDTQHFLWLYIDRMVKNLELYFPEIDNELSFINKTQAIDALLFLSKNTYLGVVNCVSPEVFTVQNFKKILEKNIKSHSSIAKCRSKYNSPPEFSSQNFSMNGSLLQSLGHSVTAVSTWLPNFIKDIKRKGKKELPSEENPAVTVDEKLSIIDLSGKVVVVTGSTSGVGKALALNCADRGAHCVINGRNQSAVDALVLQIRRQGREAIGVCADVSTQQGAHSLIQKTLKYFRGIDILINNATAIDAVPNNFWEANLDDAEHVLNANVLGAFYCSSLATKYMLTKSKGGKIINVVSDENQPTNKFFMYMTSKKSIESLTKNMASQLENTPVSVSAISLLSVDSDCGNKIFPNLQKCNRLKISSIFPVFMHNMATATAKEINGRIFNSWRFSVDSNAEKKINKNLSIMRQMKFINRYKDGRPIDYKNNNVIFRDRGENPFGVSPRVNEYFLSLAKGDHSLHNLYPTPDNYIDLRTALSVHMSLPKESFAIGTGSDSLIRDILSTFISKGDVVLTNELIYFGFEHHCAALGGVLSKVGSKGVSHNLEGILQRITSKTRLIYLISPGNPIGVGLKKKEFLAFLAKVPVHIPVIVDEAYIEYCNNDDVLRVNEIMMQTPHTLIGLRTFSKMYGLASMRIGYTFSDPDTIRLINRVSPLVPVSSVSVGAALAALSDQEHVVATQEKLKADKLWVQSQLNQACIPFVDVETVSMPVKAPCDYNIIKDYCGEKNIYLPNGTIMGDIFNFPLGQPEVSKSIVDIMIYQSQKMQMTHIVKPS